MSCSVYDLKAYSFGEIDRREKSACECHISQCPSCREELDRLQMMKSALMAVPEEEIPQRIAFVSDRVFEPRWWQTMWRSGPAMGFASALLVAGAILLHGFTRPVQIIQPVAQADTAQVDRRIRAEVTKAVAELEAREEAKQAKIIKALESDQLQRRADLLAARDTIRLYQQQMGRMMIAYNQGGSQ